MTRPADRGRYTPKNGARRRRRFDMTNPQTGVTTTWWANQVYCGRHRRWEDLAT